MIHEKMLELGRALRRRRRRSVPPSGRRLLLESLEDRRMLAANIVVTDAFLRTGIGLRDNTPVLGEQIEVQINFRTTDLFAQSAYRIDVSVDGVPLSSGTIRSGGGIANGTFFERVGGWFAEPGEHTVDVFIDAGRNVAEQNEQDNTFSFTFTPERATTLPSTFTWPEADTPFQDHVFTNYLDLDPTSAIRDWNGGTASYDGHNGWDFGAPNFAAMDAGRPILAVADGTVTAVVEGNTDRSTSQTGLPANLVTIDHGDGWTTSYIHLRRDSVQVKVGDVVQQGDRLALEGSSGNSTASHLHFEVRHYGRLVETALDPNTYWVDPLPYVGAQSYMVDSGITNYNPIRHLGERPSDVDVFSQTPGQRSYAWGVFSGLRVDDFLEFAWIQPSGAIHARRNIMLTQDYSTATFLQSVALPTTPELGTWTVDIRNNQRLLGRKTFEVTATGAPEIRVDDASGNILVDERYSPVDFGTVAQKTTPPARTFTVVNHGTDTLTLGGVVVPRGYLVTEGLGAALAPGGSETFTVTLNTSDAGYYGGQIRVFSNDADEPITNISIEGTVTSAATRTITVGIGERTIAESGKSIANVTRTGNTSLGLLVNLSNNLPRQASFPSSVLIPAGQASATFTISGINDGLEDGVQVVQVTATATDFATATNTINVVDVPTIVVDIKETEISEAAGTAASEVSIVRLGGDLTQRVEFMLTLNDLTEAAVPLLVTMEPFQSVATVQLDAVDDDILDGSRTVVLTVTAEGYEDGVDSVLVLDHETANITLDATTISEDGGGLSGTVTRSNTDNQNPLVVQLASSDQTEVTVPAQVTIPAGQASAPFAVTILDDDLLDGDQSVTITSSALAYVNDTAVLQVLDAETIGLRINNFTISENNGATTATVTRSNTNTGSPLRVSLSSNDTTEAVVPPFIDIPANQMTASFPITAVDDSLLDGNQPVVVTAVAAGYRSGIDSLVVLDHETLTVTFEQSTIFEDGGLTIGTVTRNNTDLTSPQPVVLSSSDSNQATVVSSVQIPANQASATFVVQGVNDMVADGDTVVQISAIAGGYVSAAASLTVSEQPGLSISSTTNRLSENAPAATMTVRRHNVDKSQSLTVILNNTQPNQANVPPSVVIPANSDSVTFNFAPNDDTLLDGAQPVTVTASATGLASSSTTVTIDDHETLTLVLASSSISESGPGTTATITRGNTDNQAPLTVSIQGTDPTEATTVASVTIPANQASFDFPVAAVDDALLDGTQTVTFTASAAGYQGSSVNLDVRDHEQLVVVLSASSFSERNGSVTGTVTRPNSDLGLPIIVQLASNDPSEATVSTFVQIPAQQTSATFTVTSVDDSVLDGTQNVVISATSTGYVAGSANLSVTDHEALSVTLNESSISEANGMTSGMVTRGNADISSALTVQLRSNDASEATVLATVEISANEISAPFQVFGVNDMVFDGDQVVTIIASATGYIDGQALLTVTDHENLTLNLNGTTMSEQLGSVTATVSRSNSDVLFSTTVTVSTDLPGRTSVARTVIIKAGQTTSAPFRISAIDNHILDGTSTANISVTAPGYDSDTKPLTVTDFETLNVLLQESAISESGGQTTAVVRRNNVDINQQLLVTLAGNDLSEAQLPSSVLIPAGESASALFTIFGVDDNVFDGDQTVTITATATGYQPSNTQLQVTDLELLSVSIDATSVSELNGQATGTVTRLNSDIGQPLLVSLTGGDDSEATVPANVLIPANVNSQTFTIAARDDTLLDGTQPFTVTAEATGYAAATASLDVTDVETLSLTFAQSTISESGGQTTLTVTRSNSNVGQTLAVALSGGDASEVAIPQTILIPANATSATVAISAVDDRLLDGTQTVTLSATATGYVSATASLDVADHETLSLTIADSMISELDGTTTATISRSNLDDNSLLTVTVLSQGTLPDNSVDANPPLVQATVDIPAGVASVSFPILAADDDLLTGERTATLTASATGFTDETASLALADVETLAITVATLPLVEGTSTTATVTRGNSNVDGTVFVSLSNSQPARLSVPQSVTIPAGQASATFNIDSLDDGLDTGNQTFSIGVSASGYQPGSFEVEVEPVTFHWQNPVRNTDVNNDGSVTPADVLILINDLNRNGSRRLPTTGAIAPPPFLDVNGDGFITANDVIVTINEINGPSPSEEGEGESAPSSIAATNGHVELLVAFDVNTNRGHIDLENGQIVRRSRSPIERSTLALPTNVLRADAVQPSPFATRAIRNLRTADADEFDSVLDALAADVASQHDIPLRPAL